MNKPYTPHQVLQAWLETQIGSPQFVKPKSYKSAPSSRPSTAQSTKRRAANIVESMPMYDIARPRLIAACQAPIDEMNGLALVVLENLQAHLLEYPFYPTTDTDLEDGATPVVYLTVKEAAEELGVKPQTIRNMVCQGVFVHTISYKRSLTILSDEIRLYKENRKTA